jgi:tetratricopeptide (TPR) repeat protein
VQLVIEKLEAGPGNEYPGIAAWKQDFAKATKGIDAEIAPQKWPPLDALALVTRNPNFWRAYYEIAPGDPGLALLHAGLLLTAGEATRASDLIIIAGQRPGVPAEVRPVFGVIAGGGLRAGLDSNALVEEGTKLFDAGDLAAALEKHKAALKLWPQNGWAHYEFGLTLRQQQWLAAGVKPPASDKVLVNSGPKNSPEVAAAFAKARHHDPFQFKAYQGDDQEVIAGLTALVKKALPAWQQLNKQPQRQVEDKVLEQLAEGLQEADQHELALAARQIVVARRGRFLPEDHPFITKSLQKLAPGKTTDATLQRLAGGKLAFRQLMAPENSAP